MQSIIMMSVVTLSVVLLNVVAPTDVDKCLVFKTNV
jgi:hypothetical protein